MDFKQIGDKLKQILIIVKDRIIIIGKWICEKAVICGKKIKEISIKIFAFLKNFFIEIKEKRIEKKSGTQPVKVKSTETKSTAARKTSSLNAERKNTAVLTDEEQREQDEKKKRIILYIIAGILILILFFILFGGIRKCSSSSRLKEKQNVMSFATKYAGRGEFDRALDKLDNYLEKHGDDDEVWDLWNAIIELKKNNGNGSDNLVNNSISYPDNLSVEIDTSDLSTAMQNAIEESRRQAEENRKAMEELMRLQNEANTGNSGKLSPEEEEKRALQVAAAEQKRILEEKQKAEEEAIAKENAALKAKIDAVNDEIAKGKNALAAGKVDEAIKYFNNARSLMPDVPGNPNFGAGKESEMAQALFEAAENSTNPNEKEKLMNQAVNYATSVINQNPNDSRAHNILAQNAMNKKDYENAAKELEAAANQKDDPNRYLYYYNLGKVQYIMKKYNDAATSFKTSCDLKSDFAPSRYNLGITQKQLKNESGALDSFRRTVQIDSNHEKAYLEQARILAARSDYLGAIDAYKAVLRINSVNSAAAMELGSVYYKRKAYQDAIDSYKRAITMLSPGEEMTLTKYNLSTALFDNGNIDEAVKYAKEAYDSKENVKNAASKANVVYNYALVLDNTGKIDAAIPVYNEVLKLNPNHTKTKINLGNMYMALNPPQLDMALKLYKEVYDKENSNFEANNNLGTLYLTKADYLNSIKYFQNALRIQPKNNEVRENLAKAYAQNGEYESAKSTYTDLIKSDKSNWDAYIELAKVCMQLNQNALADEYLTYVQVNNPSYKKVEINNLLSAIKVE